MRNALAVVVLTAAASLSSSNEDRPNLLVILSDDQGYGDLSLHGNKLVETPRLDALFQSSVELTNFHAAPVCSPTRASLMTGKQFLRAGVWGVHGGRDYLDLSEVTIADRLRESGYRTAMAGKWHLGKTQAYLPYNRGFDVSWSITDRLYMHTDPVIDHNGEELRPKGWTVDILTDYLLDWIKDGGNKPFFAYLAHPYIHEPFYAPEPLIEKYRKKGLSESFSRLCAMTEHLDEATDRLLKRLDDMGFSENTLILFMGDNGPIGNPVNVPHLTEEEMTIRNPEGFRGLKGNLYENGTRAPFMARWPGRFEAMRSDQEVDITDVVPTLLDAAGIDFHEGEFDGVSLLPLLSGEVDSFESPRRYYANHQAIWSGRERLYDFLEDKAGMRFDDQVLAMRYGDYKYVIGYGNQSLFNVVQDPQERENLVPQNPELANQMRADLQEWWEVEVLGNPTSYVMPIFPLPIEEGRKICLHSCAPVAVLGDVVQGSHYSHDWRKAGDGLEFSISLEKAGSYSVGASVKVGDDAGTVEISSGKERIRVDLSAFNKGHLGKLKLGAGEHRIRVELVEGKGDSVKVSELYGLYLTRR